MPQRKLTLPAWFGDHMLLQQQVRIRIYGNAEAGKTVRLTLERFPSGDKLSSGDTEYGIIFQESDFPEEDGFFEFKLPLIEASYDHFRMTIECDGERAVFQDILFGELWIAAGASNMAMPAALSDVRELIPEIAENRGLRFFTQNENGLASGTEEYSQTPLARSYGGHWLNPGDRDGISNLSAAGLSFVLKLQKEMGIPIGLFNLACPDSCIHSWLPGAVVEQDAIIKNHVREIKHYRDKDNWNQLPPEEKREERHFSNKVAQTDMAALPPPFSRLNQQGALFNHKLAPYTSLAIRGLIWYQGEEDVQYPDYYMRAFIAFSAVVKELFQAPVTGLKLIYSQLTPSFVSDTDFMRLAVFNEALSAVRRRLDLQAGMITTYDLPLSFDSSNGRYGSMQTPSAKKMIGLRMAQLALGLAYKFDLPDSAPECVSAETVGNKLLLSFDNVGKGIRLRQGDRSLKGFTICGRNRQNVLAEARELYQVRVIVWHDEIAQPVSCSYAFYTFNMEANLCASNGMPLVPFRLDRDMSSQEKPRAWANCESLSDFRIPKMESHSLPRQHSKNRPGIYPLWTLFAGRGQFCLETENKRHGRAAIMLKYSKADERPVIFGPILDYASDYPPLDLHLWNEMVIHLFNTEHRVKLIKLHLADANGRETYSETQQIKDILSWQDIHFELATAPVDLMRLTKIEFILQDPEAQGVLTIDEVSFRGLHFEP